MYTILAIRSMSRHRHRGTPVSKFPSPSDALIRSDIPQFACGGIFCPCNPIISHWFKKKRGRALGYRAIGASLGGTIFPIAVKNLIPRVGYEDFLFSRYG